MPWMLTLPITSLNPHQVGSIIPIQQVRGNLLMGLIFSRRGLATGRVQSRCHPEGAETLPRCWGASGRHMREGISRAGRGWAKVPGEQEVALEKLSGPPSSRHPRRPPGSQPPSFMHTRLCGRFLCV